MSKIKKVTIELEDGTSKYIEGTMAEKWDYACTAITHAVLDQRVDYFEGIEWKTLPG